MPATPVGPAPPALPGWALLGAAPLPGLWASGQDWHLLPSRLERCHLNVVELLRQTPAWVFQNPRKEGLLRARPGQAGGGLPVPGPQSSAAAPGHQQAGPARWGRDDSIPRLQGARYPPGIETASFCQRLGTSSEDRGLTRACHAQPGPRPPSVVCRAVGLDPGGDRTWGAWPIAPQLLMPRPAVTTSSVCGMVGRGGACWRGLWEAWWPCPTGLCFLALGVLEYRVLGTNFRDFAIVFTQLEQREEAFSTVELYSEWPRGQRRVCCPCRPPPGPALTRHPPNPPQAGRHRPAQRL